MLEAELAIVHQYSPDGVVAVLDISGNKALKLVPVQSVFFGPNDERHNGCHDLDKMSLGCISEVNLSFLVLQTLI